MTAVIQPRWKHQDVSLKHSLTTPHVLDFSDPGTGKTRVRIDAYNARKGRKRWLILCPMTLMRSAWGADIEKYAPNLTVGYATAERREEAFQMQTDVVVMNLDGVKWFMGKGGKLDVNKMKYLKQFDELTIDEITGYKHPTSQRSKAAAKIAPLFDYRSGMTATPNPKTVMELWHPALIIDGGKRLGKSYYQLRAALQTQTQIGPQAQHVRWDDKPGASQSVNELLKDITVRHAFEDVMTHVPANHRDVKTFDLSPKCRKAYDQMALDCMLAFGEKVVNAVHAASLRTKLLQIASGAVYDGAEDGTYEIVDTRRYELITELVEEREHSVVFFNWKHQRDQLCASFENAGKAFALIDGSVPQARRDRIVQDYQAGKYQTILLHPRTGAHGLTLTRGTTTIISSPIYEADLLKQAIYRIYRGEQNQVTNTILIQANGTVEGGVYDQLNGNTARMEDLLGQFSDNKRYRK